MPLPSRPYFSTSAFAEPEQNIFLALPEDVEFSKIIGYRTMEIPAKMPKEKKRFYQRMKKIHKLPDPPDRVRLEKDLEAILAKGGDISHLIK